MRLTLLFGLLLATPLWAASALPADSIYQADIQLTDQSDHSFALADRRGHVQLVSMLYTACPMVCPMIVDTLGMTRKAVGEPAADALQTLVVSIDPERDDTATLREYAARRHLNLKHWTLARAEEDDVRTLAALLGIKYRQLPDGEFNHSSELLALDADGRIVARTTTIGRVDPEFVATLQQLLSDAAR